MFEVIINREKQWRCLFRLSHRPQHPFLLKERSGLEGNASLNVTWSI